MKKLNIFSIIALCLFALLSCSDGDRIELGDESSFIQPVLTQTITQDFVVDKNTDLSQKIGSWTWTEANYGVNSPVLYSLETSLDDKFENPNVLSTTNGTSIDATYGLLNTGAKAYVKESGPITLYIRLKSNLGTASQGPIFYSETKSVSFTCYVAAPDQLYMSGSDFGNWDWTSDDVVKLIPIQNNSNEGGAFWCVRYLTAGNGFRWSPEKNAGESYGEMETNIGFTNDEKGNAVVATSGLYTIFINYITKTIAIEPAQIFGIGEAFGGWDSDTYSFTITNDKASIVTSVAGNLRMYATSPAIKAFGSDWWRHEFNIFSGKIAYRGTGGDQDPVAVKAGQKVTLDFNAGTGTIQ